MPNETITIGGKNFEVACQPGEEHYLRAAAAMLDNEAQVLIGQIGRLPEAKMLLMAGLMLADKTAGAEDRVRQLEGEMASLQAEVERLKAQPKTVTAGPSGPSEAELGRLADLAMQAEYLADQMEAR
ncbi:cell division protein ZapA [Pararhodobacter sp. CCB-MM2]|uniref:cell division protein ZapA n=1 Tax=Pararhodobacter sp. CCB-MM2 TaxID=1786003 RepID=UPI00082F17A6|nr:cell division protein ZapA [Pararhodobacter sp. CCB-MM2]MCA2010548.1 cell division protein ZapA [Cereibacter sphaeroides]